MKVLLALLTTAIAGADFTLQAQTSVPCAAPVGMAPTVTASWSAQTVTVSWSAVRGAVGYAVIRKNPDATCWNITPRGTTATSLQETMLPGGNYEYQVAVQLLKGQGLSEWAPVTVMPSLATTPLPVTLAPAPTTSLTPMNDGPAPAYLNVTGTPTTASLTWAPVTGAVNYGVNRELALVSSNITLLTTTTATTFNDVLPDPTQTYRYKVLAYQSNGHFGTAAATFTAPPPTNPTGLIGTASNQTVTLSWQPVQYAAGYLVSGPGISSPMRINATTYSVSAAPVGSNVYKVGSVFDPGALSTASSAFPSVTVPVYAPVASCGCPKTGDFVAPTFNPITGSAQSAAFQSKIAGTFTVTVSGTSIDIRDASNRSVLSEAVPAAWGTSPDGNYFFTASKLVNGLSTVAVYPVRVGPLKWKSVVTTTLAADGMWGFSSDESMFITRRYVQARFIAEAYNLLAQPPQTPQTAKLDIDETNAFSASITTSPCGDRLSFWHPALGEGHFYRRTIFPAKSPEVLANLDGSGQPPSATIISPATNVFLVQLTGAKTSPGGASTFPSLQCTP